MLAKNFTGKESFKLFHNNDTTKDKRLDAATNLGRSLIIYHDRKDVYPVRKLHNKTKANTVQTTPSPSSLSLHTYTFFSPNTLTLTISNVLNYNVLKLVSPLKKILCTSVTAREFDIVATSWYGSQSSADSFLTPMTQITVLTSAEVTVTVSVTVWLHHAK